ncbi:MAG: LysM peptidoglycan-binding domain-containing M23 family metallopeptidase [Candidatus Omnitrophica bacterium]|nr:LysM peptidoglycan-binding domain-containing M23 family metallopeptidase [Candidatus Omnitrophota bacterium]
MKNVKHIFLTLTLSLLALFFSGCASQPIIPSTKIEGLPGIYHKVEKGETLWRISKMYNIDIDEIIRVNRIPESSSIEIGQLIFIPNQKKQTSQPAIKYSSSDDFTWPAKGRILLGFGQTSNNILNKGINIQAIESTDVIAARNGRVSFCADEFGQFGKTIIIDHQDGFFTIYSRNSKVFVKPGDSVQKGAVIAKVGNASRDKNNYLHFEIRKGPYPQNPNYYLP